MMAHMTRFSICSLYDIESNGTALAHIILADKNAMDAVIESLNTTAVSQIEYTRSIAILARHIEDNLDAIDIDLAAEFRERLTDEAISTYISFWENLLDRAPKGYARSNALAAADPIAVSAFVGDLLSSKMIDFEAFEGCLLYLMDGVTSALHLRCLRTLFAHGCARYQPETSHWLFKEYMDRINRRCEEQKLRELLHDLMFRPPAASYPNVVDRHLDLDGALMASVCPVNWHAENRVVVDKALERYTPTHSSECAVSSMGSRSPSSSPALSEGSDSEVLLGFATHMKAPVLHHPQPVYGYVTQQMRGIIDISFS
ncbi:hypothetical protein BJ912DRAFT_1047195 [Pholiota molesta]|nr:hypothetical protein BJ912DRAFT_1047195 [Pholiota molesta]